MSSSGNSVGQEGSMDRVPMPSGPTQRLRMAWGSSHLAMGFRMDARHTKTNKRP